MAKLTLSIIIFTLSFIPAKSVYKTVCDCSQPQTKGILDLEQPPHCKNNKSDPFPDEHVVLDTTFYSVVTKARPEITWNAHSCSQWTETKTITGSFWIGSFDTVYTTSTKHVEPGECWNMIQNYKCGGNTMIKSGST